MQARTFTETSRRTQIVAAAIETIAREGYPRASFARIARQAGLSSTGLISYHFASKRELVEQVVGTVYAELGTFMAEQMEGQPTAAAALRTYISANVRFAATHHTQMQALMNIFVSGDLDYDAASDGRATAPVEQLLHWGQRTGEFRDFDVPVMATSLQRSVEGPSFLLAREQEGGSLDLDHYVDELVTLFDLATRRQAPS